MSLSADDIRAIIREELQAVGRPPGWVLPPKGSDWTALPDGSYVNKFGDQLYYDPNVQTTSGYGMWQKQTWRGVFPGSGGPSHGFWGDDTEP
jgi:hypothetical protein